MGQTPAHLSDARTLRRWRGWLVAAAVAGAVLLSAVNLWFGPLNQDEGWYLYAARAVSRGRRPYLDFFFTQGPTLPCVYGWLAPLWAPFGVLGGRGLSALLGLAAAGAAGALAAALTPSRKRRFHAGLLAFALLGVNVYHSYFTSIPKTYALAALLLTAGMFLLLRVRDRGAGSLAAAAAAGWLTAGAVGARFSLAMAAALIALSLLIRHRRYGLAGPAYILGGLVAAAGLYGPALVSDFEAVRFSLAFHAQRAGGDGAQRLLLAAGSLARTIQGYFVVILVAVTTAAGSLAGPRPPRHPKPSPSRPVPALTPALLFGAFALTALVHLASPFPYDDYQVPILPLLAVAASVEFWRRVPRFDRGSSKGAGAAELAVLSTLLLMVFLAAGASPRTQDWFVYGQDRFWVRLKPASDLARLREAGRWIRERTAPGETVLTQDAYLAVEAERPLPAGFEMGPFSLFPGLNDSEAERFHVLTPGLLRKRIENSAAPVAALSGYGFALAAPRMRPLDEATRRELIDTLLQRYRPVRVVPDFGQQYTELTLLVRRD